MKVLHACPDRPNCVSSLATRPDQRLDPIAYSGDSEDAQRRLESILLALPRARILAREKGFIEAEFRSRIFRFVDWAQFSFDDRARLIHFRCGARLGYSDFGVNRARMQRIAAAFRASAP